MAEIEITSEEELEAWLEDKPREVAVAIATRAALRVFPLLMKEADYHDFDNAIILPVCRAMALSWAVGKYPAHGKDLQAAAAYAASYTANSSTAYSAYAAYAAAKAAAKAAAHAANAYAAASAAYAANSTAYASAYATNAAAYATNAASPWSVVSSDVRFLVSGEAGGKQFDAVAAALVQQKLWPDEIADFMPKEVEVYWREMAEFFDKKPDDNWQVWKKWYEAHLHGQPTVKVSAAKNREVDLAIAKIADEDWKKGPAHVNGIIADLFEEAEKETKIETPIKTDQSSSQKLAEHFQTVSLSVDALIKANAAERENHISKKPNYPQELEQWAELDKYFENTGNSLGKIQTELQKADNKDDVVDVAENTIPILIEYRDELINQLRSNKKGVVNLILKTSCFAGSVALLNLVGIPPLVSLSISASLLGANEVSKALRDYYLNKDK